MLETFLIVSGGLLVGPLASSALRRGGSGAGGKIDTKARSRVTTLQDHRIGWDETSFITVPADVLCYCDNS